jgi:hypothetical protein
MFCMNNEPGLIGLIAFNFIAMLLTFHGCLRDSARLPINVWPDRRVRYLPFFLATLILTRHWGSSSFE